MDEIKKNRVLDEQEEKFSFRDKNFVNNYLSNDKNNNNSSKVYNDNNNNKNYYNKDYGNRGDETIEKVCNYI